MKKQLFASSTKYLVYPARTTIAAALAFFAARGIGLPEVYWATISAIIVVQSDFNSSLKTSLQRLAGTALGSFIGALLLVTLGKNLPVYALGIFCVGLMAQALQMERPANRFAAISLSIVMLVARTQSTWTFAFDRFLEVSAGIVAGLILSATWPERNPAGGESIPR